ncbi:Cytochrome P450 89A2 [Zea mays]|jgi:cytochrome P450 family 89 subfamily A|uniref:Cytochrome P450 89A2 n=3 Tax=Zea mays TaxID=4577 RepID=A0A3L6FV89_MAIZE|nr:Cytochrome P450 89A2 [Zea mays]|eukprot:XP_008669371.1 cytochrome P450 89A2 [Zea mays]
MDDLVTMFPHLSHSRSVTLLFLFLTTAFLLVGCSRKSGAVMLAVLRWLAAPVLTLPWHRASGGRGTRRGLSVQVTDRAVARRALVQHSAAFLDRPTGAVPSTILTRNRHYNILSAPYGPYWRAARRNVATGVLHPSQLRMLGGTRARVLGDLVRALKSGAPAGESLYFAVYSVLAGMCFGEDVVAELGETRLRAMQKFQRDILLALPSFGVFVRYPRIGRFLYRSRWHRLLALRRQQEESFLPLVAAIRNRREASRGNTTLTTYVESLLDLRIHEDGGRAVTDGELVSLISEFLGAGTESTAAALEWTMANLVKSPDLQQKLRLEANAMACGKRVIEEEDLARMPYLRAVVLESLRRHPPVPFVIRRVDGDDAKKVIGVSRLPDGGATVNFLVGKIGRDPAAWSDPMSFKPERFMPGGEGDGTDLTCTTELKMMPFGAGRRVCPGLATAMLHLKYFVANLLTEFEWWEAEDDKVDLTEFRGFFFTVMNRPLQARLVPTDAAAAPWLSN